MDIWNQIFPTIIKRHDQIYLKIKQRRKQLYNTDYIEVMPFRDRICRKKLLNYNIRWFREIDRRKYEIKTEGNIYHFCYQDIGHQIIFVVEAEDKRCFKIKKWVFNFN